MFDKAVGFGATWMASPGTLACARAVVQVRGVPLLETVTAAKSTVHATSTLLAGGENGAVLWFPKPLTAAGLDGSTLMGMVASSHLARPSGMSRPPHAGGRHLVLRG
jgi:hypothetical protein